VQEDLEAKNMMFFMCSFQGGGGDGERGLAIFLLVAELRQKF